MVSSGMVEMCCWGVLIIGTIVLVAGAASCAAVGTNGAVGSVGGGSDIFRDGDRATEYLSK